MSKRCWHCRKAISGGGWVALNNGKPAHVGCWNRHAVHVSQSRRMTGGEPIKTVFGKK